MAKSLDLLHPRVKQAALALQSLAKEVGVNIIFTNTLRTEEEQKAYFAQGRKPLPEVNALRKKAGLGPITAKENKNKVTKASSVKNSWHAYGLAFDIAVVDKTGKQINWDYNTTDWDGDGVSDWLEVGRIADKVGLEWGGNWSTMFDPPHFQMRFGRTIADMVAGKSIPT
jgi:peptidoglycan L-alanyl-D-glutamate endopeptidase CwlK